MNNKKRAELILFFSVFLNNLVFFAPVAILVRTRWGITVSQFFILEAVLSFGIFIFEVPCGMLTDKIGYRTSIIISQILLCITRIIFLIGGSFFIFAVESVLAAVSISFISGTIDSYMYDMYDEDEYMPKMAVMDNCGTAGFILSTIFFVPINKLYGITGLIAATLMSLLISLSVLLFLPKSVYKKSIMVQKDLEENIEQKRIGVKSLIKDLCKKEVLFFFVLTGFMHLGSLIVSFFYIIKLADNNISEDWMSFVILGYALIHMLSPVIIKKIQKYNTHFILASAFLLIAVTVCMMNICTGYSVFVPMLLLPLLLSIPWFIISNESNRLIDKLGQENNRAGFLSVLNQGTNLFEILFLLFASAAGGKTVSLIFFLTAGCFLFLSILQIKLMKKAKR